MPERAKMAFLIHDPGLLTGKILRSQLGRLVSSLNRRDRNRAAMVLIAAQQAEKGVHQEFRIKAIGLCGQGGRARLASPQQRCKRATLVAARSSQALWSGSEPVRLSG